MPVARDQECDDLSRLLASWRPAAGLRELSRALTAAERASLESRQAALQQALTPYTETCKTKAALADLESHVGAMFNGIRSMRQTGEDVSSTVEITLAVLRKHPAWAIKRACMEISEDGFMRDGKREKHWAPNDSEINDVVKKIVQPYRYAMLNAGDLLSAKVLEEKRV